MANLSRLDIARIIGELEEVSFPADGPIFAQDVTADGVYLLPSGRGTNGRLWKLPRERPTLEPPPATRGRSTLWRTVAAVIAFGVPLALWLLPPPAGLSPAGWHVSLIVLGAALGWLLEPLPDFVVALLMAAAWGVADLAPMALIFGGFASSAWLVSLGAFALAVAMVQSGLLFRLALLSVSIFPPTRIGQVLALLISGVLITPLVPLGVARVAAIAPLARDLAHALGYRPASNASASIAFAGLVGYGLFSSIFLTGLVMNFFVLDLLPAHERARFGWLAWFVAAAPAAAIMLIGAAGVLLTLFRGHETPTNRIELVRLQRRVLGPLTRQERVTLVAVAVLLVGLLAQPLLRVDSAWLAIGALAVAIAGGGLDREHFRGAIDWGFLILFGVLLGTGGVLQHAGVGRWLGESLVPVAQAVSNPTLLVVVLGLFVVVVRMVVPWIPATLLLSLALVPTASQLGLSAWVVGFVVLTTANTWLHPNQAELCRLTRDATGGALFTQRQAIRMGIAMTVLSLIAVAASVPYWSALGI